MSDFGKASMSTIKRSGLNFVENKQDSWYRGFFIVFENILSVDFNQFGP